MRIEIPSWLGLILFSMAWVAVSCFASVLLNHQSPENKRKNAIMSFGFTMLLASWAVLASIYSGRAITWSSVGRFMTWLLTGWLLYESGDLLAFFFAVLKGSPGGIRGWIWRKVALHLTRLRDWSANIAEDAIRPTERKLIERHIAEASLAADGIHPSYPPVLAAFDKLEPQPPPGNLPGGGDPNPKVSGVTP